MINDEYATSNPQNGREQRESPLSQRFARPSSDPTSVVRERAAQANSAITRVVDKHPIATVAAAGVAGAVIGRLLGERVHVGAIAGTAFGFMARSAVRTTLANGLARVVHAYQNRE